MGWIAVLHPRTISPRETHLHRCRRTNSCGCVYRWCEYLHRLRHKDACAGMAAEAAKAKADKAADKDSSGGAGGGKAMKTNRNKKCPCGSGKLYKKCCI